MAHDDTKDHRFKEAVHLLRNGADGDKKAAREAYAQFSELRASEPSNALIEACYGSALALMGRDAVQPLERSDKAQQGLDALDRAVAMSPNDIEIRLIRANVCMRLPEDFFRRTRTAIADYSFLLARHDSNAEPLTERQLVQLLHDLGSAYKKIGKPEDAKAAWKRLAQLDPSYSYLAK